MNRDLIIFFTASHYWQWNDPYAVPFLVNMFVYDMFVHNSIQSNAMQCNGCRNSAATNCHAIVVDDWRIFLEYYLRLSGAEPGIVIDRLYCTLQKGSRCFCMGQKCPKNWSLPWGSWPPCNECMVPWAHASQFPKQHPDWFSHFCVQRSKTYSDYERAGQFPKIAPTPWEIWTPSNTCKAVGCRSQHPPRLCSMVRWRNSDTKNYRKCNANNQLWMPFFRLTEVAGGHGPTQIKLRAIWGLAERLWTHTNCVKRTAIRQTGKKVRIEGRASNGQSIGVDTAIWTWTTHLQYTSS